MLNKSEPEAIIILGYSLNQDGTLHPLLEARLVKALALCKPGTYIIASGKMPPPQLLPNRCSSKTEAAAMKDFLVKNGVGEEHILLEELSMTTFGNAFFSKRNYLDPMGIKVVNVISNIFHLPLVRYCFHQVLGKCSSI